MLPHVITGYEPQFDFPEFIGAPGTPYLLASVPRAGSTWFSHLLWQTGCLGAPLEYLNFEPAGPSGNASRRPDLQNAVWNRAMRFRTSPNGVFGLKGFPVLFEELGRQNPDLLGRVMQTILGPGTPRKVVYLRRRDRTAHAISYARALLSGIWRSEQESPDRHEPAYSSEAIAKARALIESQEGAWQAMYADLQIVPLELYFEDALEDGEGARRMVADYLGVPLNPGLSMDVPEIRKQSVKGGTAWRRQYDADIER